MTLPAPLLVLAWACLWAGAAGVMTHQRSWGSCDNLVCQEVQKQAEGLSRLKVMRNYLMQMVIEMETLLISLDKEVIQTSQDIGGFIGHQCPDVHPLLQQINMEYEDEGGHTRTQVLDQHTSESQTQTQTSSQESEGEIQDRDRGDFWPLQQSTGSSHNLHESAVGLEGSLEFSRDQTTTSVDRTSSSNDSSTHHSSSSSRNTENSNTYESGQELTNKFDQTITSPRKTTKLPKKFTTNYGGGGTGSGYGGADSGSRTYSRWRSSTSRWDNRGSGGSPRPGGSGEYIRPGGLGGSHGGSGGRSTTPGGPGESQCRGVPRESQFWIPGLDKWCPTNCAAGYCPSNLCLC